MSYIAPAPHTTCSMSMFGQIGVWVVQGFDEACNKHRSVALDSSERSYALTGLAAACELLHDMEVAELVGLSRKVLLPLHNLRRQEAGVSYEIEIDMVKALVAPSHALVNKFFWQTSSSRGAHFLPLVSTGPYILLTSVLKLRAADARYFADPSAVHEVNKVIVAEVLALALLADMSKADPTHARAVNEESWRAFAAAARGADLVAARAYVEQGALGVEVAQQVAQWCRNHTRSDARSSSPVAAKTIKHALDWVKNVLQSAPDVLGQGRSVPPPAVERRSLGEASRARFVPQARRIASRF
ncbi:hypothetical protein JCM9279_002345 [Rhodotorula babjevae]